MIGTDKTIVGFTKNSTIHSVHVKNAPMVIITRNSHGVYSILTGDAKGNPVHISLHKHTLRAIVLYSAQWLFDDVVAICRNKLRVRMARKRHTWPWYLRWFMWFK